MEEEDTREVLLPNWQGSGSMGLTLDQNDDGVFVKQLVQNSPAAKTGVVKEGDQVVGATVYFENMSSGDIEKLLANVGHHTVGLKLQRKGDRSPLPGATYSHDVFSVKSPDVVLSGDDEEYRRIYTKKIKPRLKSEETLEPESQTRTITVTRKVTAYTVDVTGAKDSKEIDISSPEYKIKIPRHEITEISKTSVQTDEAKTVIRIPGIDVSGKSYQAGREHSVSLPGDSVDVHSTTVRYHEHGKGEFEFPEGYSDADANVQAGSTSSLSINLPGVNVSAPKFQSYENKFEVRTSKFETEHDRFKGPNVSGSSSVDLGLLSSGITRVPKQDKTSVTSETVFQSSGIKFRGPQYDIKKAEGFKMETAALGEIPADVTSTSKETQSTSIMRDIKTPEKNVLPLDTRGGSVNIGLPSFQMSKSGSFQTKLDRTYNQATLIQEGDVSAKQQLDVFSPSAEGKATTAKIELPMPSVDVKGPDIDLDDSVGKIHIPSFKIPKFGVLETNAGMSETGIKLPGTSVYTYTKEGKTSVIMPDIDRFKLEKDFHGPAGGVTNSQVASANIDIKGPQLGFQETVGLPKESLEFKGVKMPTSGIAESKLQGPGVGIKIGKQNIGISGIDTDINVSNRGGDLKGSSLKIESIKSNLPKVSVPDIDASLKGPKIEGDLKDIQAPDFRIRGPEGKMKGPKFEKPQFDINLPNVSVSDVDLGFKHPKVEGDVKGSKVDIKVPKIELRGPGIDVDGKMQDSKFELPSVHLPRMSVPESDLKGPYVNIQGPELDANIPDVNLDASNVGLDRKIKMPTFKIPKFGISKPQVEGPNIDVSLPTGNVGLTGPNIDIGAPELNIKNAEGKLKSPKIEMPSVNIDLPKVSVADADMRLKDPKIEGALTGPTIDIKGPDVNLQSPDLDLKGSKFRLPSVQMPKMSMHDVDINLKGPKIGDFKGPKIGDLKGTRVDIKAPEIDIEAPGVELEAPGVNLKGPEGKLKMPKFKIPKFGVSDPKVEGPDIDVSVPKGSINISAPSVDIQAPDVDIEGSEGKLKGPKFNMPSLNIGLPKVSMPHADLNLKDSKLEGDLKGSKVDLEPPDVDLDGKVKGSKFKLPSMQMPDLSMPDIDFNLKGPKAGGDFKGPKVDMKAPQLDIETQGVELEAPDVNLKGPDGKLKMPKFKMPKFGVSSPEVEGPDIYASLPKGSIDISAPSVDIQAPNVDIEGLEGKLKGPKFNTPSMNIDLPHISMPHADLSLKGPKLEGNLKGPKVDMKCPEVDLKAPDVDLDGKVKGSKFKLPSMQMPHLSMPDIDFNLKGPKAGGDFKGPKVDINAPVLDIKTPGVELEAPDVNLEGPEGKLKMPKFKMPKFGVSVPKLEGPDIDASLPKGSVDISGFNANIEGPDVNLPKGNLGLKAPHLKGNISGPKLGGKLEGPGMDLSTPGVCLDSPDISVKTPTLDIEGTEGNLKLPKVKKSKFGFGIKSPKADIKSPSVDINPPDLEFDPEVPELSVGGKGKKGKFKMPKIHMSGPKIKGKKGGFDVSAPEVDSDINLNAPDADLNIAGGDAAISTNLGFKAPKTRKPLFGKISFPDVEFDIKSPKIKGETSLQSPSAELKTPDLDISGGLKTPEAELTSSGVSIEGPDVKVKKPKFKLPNFSMSSPKVEAPAADVGVSLHKGDIDLTGPKISTDIKAPRVDVTHGTINISSKIPSVSAESSLPEMDVNLKGPNVKSGMLTSGSMAFQAPKVGISGSGGKIKLPAVDISSPKVSESNFDIHLKGPNIESDLDISGRVKKPSISADLPSIDAKSLDPHITLPQVDISGSHPQGFKLPKGEISLSGPDVSLANVSGKIESADLRMKGPSFQSSAAVKGSAPGINISLKDAKIKEGISIGQSANLTGDMQGSEGLRVGRKVDGGFTGPNVKGGLDVQGIGGNLESSDVKINFPRLLMPKFTSSGPELTGREVGVDVNFPSADVQVKKFGETELEVDESEIKIKKSKIKMPKLNFKSKAKGDVSLPDVSVSGSKGDLKSSKASAGSAEGGLMSTSLEVEKSPKYEFSLFTSKKTRQRSSSLSEEKDESTHSSPSGTLEAGSSLSAEGGKKKGKQSKIKFGTFGGLGSKSKGSYEVTLSDDENVQGSGASISSRKSRVSSSSSNDSATKAGVRLPKLELTVAKKKE